MTLTESDLWFTTSATASRLGVSRETLERKKEEGSLRREEHWAYIGSAPSAILWKAEACREILTKESDRGTSRLNSLSTMEDLSEPSVNSDSPTDSEQQNKEAIHRLVSSVIGISEQQREALKVILLENLHSAKARKLMMMKYCTEYVESRLKKQLEEILQEQQDLIRRTIKSELDQAKAELQSLTATEQATGKKSAKEPNYHSLVEIRALVTHNMDAICKYFQGRNVSIRVLSDHLETYTELRPGDRELLINGNFRWNQQVGNAVRDTEWPDSPFKRSDRRGYYEIEYWKTAP